MTHVRRPVLVALTAACLALTACSGGGSATAPVIAPSPSSDPATSAPDPVPSVTPSSAPSPATAAPAWTLRLHDDPSFFATYAGGSVLATYSSVLGISPGGHVRWRRPAPDETDTGVVGGVVVLSTSRAGFVGSTSRGTVTALDARTGRRLWSVGDGSATEFAVDAAHVYVSTCTGAETGALGECTITARTPRTGSVLWSAPTYANVEELSVSDGAVHATTFPTGASQTGPFQTHVELSATTGASLGPAVPADSVEAVDGLLVVPSPDDTDPSDGCTDTLRGVTLTGTTRWSRTIPYPASRHGTRCSFDGPVLVGDLISADETHGRSVVLDPRTGRIIRRLDAHQELTAADGTRVLLGAPIANTTAAYDTTTGARLWERAGSTRSDEGVVAGRVVLETQGLPTRDVVVEVRTGRVVVRVIGGMVALGPDWIANYVGAAGEASVRFSYTSIPD